MNQLRAALAVRQEAVGALIGPFHRAVQRLRRVQDAGIFGIIDVLHPERAADIGGEDADLFRRHVEDPRKHRLVAGDALGRNLKGVALGGLVERSKCRARFHRHYGDAVIDDVELGHMGGARKRRIDLGGVAVVIVERDVVGDVLVELRRAGLCRFRRIGDGRQRVDVDLDCFGGIACLRRGLRDDNGYGIADKAHLVGRKRRAVGLQQR